MSKVTASSNTMQFSISGISKLTSVRSQEVLLHGIPWQVEVKKIENGTQKSLGVYLYCTSKDKSSNWAATACATIKLLPFNDDKRVIKHYISPYVHDRFVDGYGTTALIQWNDLFNEDNKYVEDDTIEVEAKIVAENPNSLNRSILKFDCIDKACDCCCQVTYKLTVMNVANLMAIRTPDFIMRGMPLCIMVFKNDADFGIRLNPDKRSKNASCQVTMSVKLVSSKENVDPIKKSDTKKIQWPANIYIGNLVSWNELMKPGNGFVKENSITLEIEIKSDKPEGDVPIANPRGVVKLNSFECSICLDALGSQDMSTTPCGHSFCTACITKAVRNRRVCPLCQAAVQLNELRRLFLSAAK